MKESHIVLALLLPTDQDPSEAIHPAVGTLDDPATRFEPGVALETLGFFSTPANVRRVPELLREIPDLVVIVSPVQAEILELSSGAGSIHRNTFQGGLDQPHVVPIGSINCQTDGHSASLRQQATLDAVFGSIRRVGARFFPRPTEPWSSPRPSTATSTESLGARHTLRVRTPKSSGTPRPLANLGTARALSSCCRFPSRSAHSTDNPSSERRGSRRRPCGPPHVAVLHRNDACSPPWGSAAGSFPTTRPRSA